jgi:hypothetical protein
MSPNSYINLLLDARRTETRLHSVFETDPEQEAGHSSLVGAEASIWMVTFALVILGVTKAAYSSESMVWLAVWPAPLVLIWTITAFLRQGCYCRDGVLVVGRRWRSS